MIVIAYYDAKVNIKINILFLIHVKYALFKRGYMAKKTIKIMCEGAELVDINNLLELQGDLKVLEDKEYEKLKKSILDLGFSFPVQAWKDGNKIYILDAHQRTRALKKMRDEEGYQIPLLPVAWIKAKDKREAAKKVLAATSQYGQVTNDGLHSFMNEFDLSLDQIKDFIKLPEIDMKAFENAYFPELNEVAFKAKVGSIEIDEKDFQKFNHQCPKCGFGFN